MLFGSIPENTLDDDFDFQPFQREKPKKSKPKLRKPYLSSTPPVTTVNNSKQSLASLKSRETTFQNTLTHLNETSIKNARRLAKLTKQIQLVISDKLRQVVTAVIIYLAVAHLNSIVNKDSEIRDFYFSLIMIAFFTALEIQLKRLKVEYNGAFNAVYDFLSFLSMSLSAYFVFPAVRIFSNKLTNNSNEDYSSIAIILRFIPPLVIISAIIVIIEKVGAEDIMEDDNGGGQDDNLDSMEAGLLNQLNFIPNIQSHLNEINSNKYNQDGNNSNNGNNDNGHNNNNNDSQSHHHQHAQSMQQHHSLATTFDTSYSSSNNSSSSSSSSSGTQITTSNMTQYAVPFMT